MLQEYNWLGNIRELKNVIERDVILSDGNLRLDLALAEEALRQVGTGLRNVVSLTDQNILSNNTVKQIERNNIINALEVSAWRISGPKGAAALLEMNASTLNSKVKALYIDKPKKILYIIV